MENLTNRTRCAWVGSDPLYRAYHDEEWGVPVHYDHLLFEFLILEGAQAGLSWITILRKRATYRLAFAGFAPELVARFDESKVTELLADPGIVRNRLKVASAITNARAFLKIQEEFGSFAAYQWRFVDGQPIINAWATIAEVPASTPVSDAMSRDLKQRGFRFVGSTICYAHMQAVGMVNDHTTDCFRWRELGGGDQPVRDPATSRLKRPRYPMPDFIRTALEQRQLMTAYHQRPDYQQNDYIGWITRAKQTATQRKRLAQMLDELALGTVYMKMAWRTPRGTTA